MDIRTIKKVKNTKYFKSLPSGQALCFEEMLDMIDDRRKRMQFFGSCNTVSKNTGRHYNTVRKTISRLVKDEIFIEVPSPGNTVNIYCVVLDPVFQECQPGDIKGQLDDTECLESSKLSSNKSSVQKDSLLKSNQNAKALEQKDKNKV